MVPTGVRVGVARLPRGADRGGAGADVGTPARRALLKPTVASAWAARPSAAPPAGRYLAAARWSAGPQRLPARPPQPAIGTSPGVHIRR